MDTQFTDVTKVFGRFDKSTILAEGFGIDGTTGLIPTGKIWLFQSTPKSQRILLVSEYHDWVWEGMGPIWLAQWRAASEYLTLRLGRLRRELGLPN
jgi:hypothetical protein